MPSQFSDDLKFVLRDIGSRARGLFAALLRLLGNLPAMLRSLQPRTKLRLGLAGAAVLVFALAFSMRSGAQTAAPEHPAMRMSTLHFNRSHAENRELTAVAQRSYAVGKAQQSQGSYKEAAESYAAAAKHGDTRGIDRLVAMTRSEKCSERSEAADALGNFKNKKATAALTRLSQSQFKDEPRNPGIFACDSHRAAQKALEQQGRG